MNNPLEREYGHMKGSLGNICKLQRNAEGALSMNQLNTEVLLSKLRVMGSKNTKAVHALSIAAKEACR